MAALPKGFRVSVNNTPQAQDDVYEFGDSPIQTLNVLENDLGGQSKTLWSVYQDDPDTSANEQLSQSAVGEWVTLESGAKISISADGQILYDAAGIDAAFLQSLGAGDTWTETFTYAIRLGNGTISTATVTLNYEGENDPAAISGTATGEVTEDGSGGAAFAAPVQLAVGNYPSPSGLNFADVNGDGNLDIVSADLSDSTLSLLLGDGAGGFAPRTVVASLYKPQEAVLADIDGDGDSDIVASQGEIGQIAVFDGDGTGAFAPSDTLFTGLSFTNDVEMADLDHDGDSDVVAVGHVGGSTSLIKVWMNDGLGNYSVFADETYVASPVTDIPNGFNLADMNGDGWDDIVVTDLISQSVSVLLNDQDGTFGAAAAYATNGGGIYPASYPNEMAVADLDGDGDLDVVTANFGTDTVSVMINDGTGILAPGVTYATGDAPVGVALTDIDGDGDNDIVTANVNDNDMSALLNDGSGVFAPASSLSLGGALRPITVNPVDVNADGKMDLITTNLGASDFIDPAGDTLTLLLNTAGSAAGDPYASGDLDVADPDSGEAKFQAVAPSALEGVYGEFTFDSDSGEWTYTLDNDDPDTAALETGDTVYDTLEVTSFDGTATETIVVTIHGADDYIF